MSLGLYINPQTCGCCLMSSKPCTPFYYLAIAQHLLDGISPSHYPLSKSNFQKKRNERLYDNFRKEILLPKPKKYVHLCQKLTAKSKIKNCKFDNMCFNIKICCKPLLYVERRARIELTISGAKGDIITARHRALLKGYNE